jgi:hexosaminidase
LLVEWEDTFPYWGAQLSVIGSSGPDSPGLYSHRDVEEFLNIAAHFDLEVIPLIQTFGHFEVRSSTIIVVYRATYLFTIRIY